MKTLLKLPELNLHEQSENLAPRAKTAHKTPKKCQMGKIFCRKTAKRQTKYRFWRQSMRRK